MEKQFWCCVKVDLKRPDKGAHIENIKCIYDPAEKISFFNYEGDKYFTLLPAIPNHCTCYAAMKYLGDMYLLACVTNWTAILCFNTIGETLLSPQISIFSR